MIMMITTVFIAFIKKKCFYEMNFRDLILCSLHQRWTNKVKLLSIGSSTSVTLRSILAWSLQVKRAGAGRIVILFFAQKLDICIRNEMHKSERRFQIMIYCCKEGIGIKFRSKWAHYIFTEYSDRWSNAMPQGGYLYIYGV